MNPWEHSLFEQSIDHVSMAEEVDALDARRAIGNASAGEKRINRATALVDRGIDLILVAKVNHDGSEALDRDVIHHHDIGTQ